MAESKKVESKDVIQQDLFAAPKKSADQFADSLDKIVAGFMSILSEQQKFLQQNKGNVKQIDDIKKLNEAIEKSKKARQGLFEAQKLQIKLDIEKERLTQQQIKTQKAQSTESERAARAADKLKKETEKLNSIYLQQSKRLLAMKKEVKDLLASEKELTDTDKKLIKETQELDDKLKKIDKTLGDGHRSVGLYADGIKEAIAGTRLFDGELAHTLVQLKSLQKQWKENTEGSNKFTNAVKLTAVGLLLLAVGVAKALADAGKETSQVVSDFIEIKNAQFGTQKAIDAAARSAAKLAGDETGSLQRATELRVTYIKLLTSQTKALEKLGLAQHALLLDEEDFRQISTDTTIGLSSRNKALKEAQRIEKERLDNELEQAKIKAGLAQIELQREEALAGIENAKTEFYAKRNEAVKALKSAEDALADTIRINDEEQRKLNIETAAFEVDLILKKKQSANADKVILENQLADEKRQLEERRITAEELLKVNEKTTAEEIKLFKENTGIQFDEKELLAEQDAVLLQRKLEGIKQVVKNQEGENEVVGIGTEATVLLAKIIKQAQENQIANAEQIKKLDEEEIKRKQKIADIEKEIVIIQQQSIVESTQESATKQKEISEKANEDILNQEGVFERKKIKRRKFLADEALKADKEAIEEKIKLIELQRDKEIQAANDSITDAKIREKEIAKIRAKSIEDIGKLVADQNAADIEFQEKELEELRKREIRRTEIVVEKLQAVTNALQNEVQKQNEKRQEGIDKEISDREKAIDRQAALAEQGLENQYAFEIAAKEQAELKKKEIEEKAQREEEILQLTDAYFNALNARLKEPGANPNNAAYLALGDVLLARGVAKGLVQFAAEGNNMIEGPGTTTSDSVPFMLSKKEAVIKASENIKHNDAVVALNAGVFDQMYMPRLQASDYSKSDNSILNGHALSLFAGMKQDLAEIRDKPTEHWSLDVHNQWVRELVSRGNKKRTTFVPPRNFHS